MKKIKIVKISLVLGLCLYDVASFSANKLPNQDNPSTPLGPTLKGRYSSLPVPNIAYSVLGEAGFKQARIGGTVGYQFGLEQRLKFSAEYLWQQINYPFFTDDSYQWVNQGAIGIGYSYLFLNTCMDPAFDIEAYFSHSPSKSLLTQRGIFTDKFGDTRFYNAERRVEGSNGLGFAPGFSLSPWFGAKANLAINYDDVSYNKKYLSNKNINGLGASIGFTQALSEYVFIGATSAIRKTFNNYTAKIAWISVPYYGGLWNLGFDAAYTNGKGSLYSSWDVSLIFEYFLGPYPVPIPLNLNTNCNCSSALPMPPNNHFLSYTAKPSIYLPQVLAVADERVVLTAI